MKKYILLITIFIFLFHHFSFGQGSTYSGSYTSSSPIVLENVSNQTINGLEISNSSGRCIYLSNCSNVTIKNCKLGPSSGEGIYLANCTNITVTNCSMDAVASGVVADVASGIKVTYNDVRNVQGPMPRGQMVQFGNVTGTGNVISYNAGENITGQSYPEDEISLYMSSGTADDPIQVVGNWIRGGGPSASGGGIMTGDMGGSYILVQDNILVNPGQYGITIASGHDIIIKNNKIFSEKTAVSNVGLSAYKQYEVDTYSNTIMNNQVNFTNKNGILNDMWNSGNAGTITGWNTNVHNANLNSSILPSTIIGRAKLAGTDVTTPTAVNYKISPNPSFGESIIVSSDTPNAIKIAVYSSTGQKMIDQSISSTRTVVDTSNLTAGVYVVKISNADDSVVEARKITVKK